MSLDIMQDSEIRVPGQATHVMIVDDHPLLVEGLASLLKLDSSLTLVGHAATPSEAMTLADATRPDLALVDIQLGPAGRMSGLEVLRSLRGSHPETAVVMLTTFKSPTLVREAMASGASGYLLKSMLRHQLLEALHAVRDGCHYFPPGVSDFLSSASRHNQLSNREINVLKFVAQGRSNREIGRMMSISEDTVKAHMRHIMDKLDAQDRTHAVTEALRHGWLILDGLSP